MHSRAIASLPSNNTLPVMALFLLVVACATQQVMKQIAAPRSGDVAMAPLVADESQAYPVAANEKYEGTLPFYENTAPAYPADLLTQNLAPVTVRVRVIVNEVGHVTDSLALEAPADYPQFFAAVQAVTQTWRYWPLVRITPADETTEIRFDDFVSTYFAHAVALPFRQDYEFTFTQKDGQGIITTVAPAPK